MFICECCVQNCVSDVSTMEDYDDFAESSRIRPNTAFLSRYVGNIERSNLRHLPADKRLDEDNTKSDDCDLETFRSEGRHKLEELAECYGNDAGVLIHKL